MFEFRRRLVQSIISLPRDPKLFPATNQKFSRWTVCGASAPLVLSALFIALAFPCLAETILDLKTSPDGRFIAVAYSSGELGILDLEYPGPIPIYTLHLDRGFAWAPDSRSLAFLERFPSRAPELWIVRPAEGERAKAPLVAGNDWKAAPCFVGPNKLAYLSERESDHVNVWEADLATGEARMLLDLGFDATGLWPGPAEGEMIYRSEQSDAPELWLSRPEPQELIQLTREAGPPVFVEDLVTLSPSGKRMAFWARGNDLHRLVCFSLETRGPLAEISVPEAPASLSFAGEDRILIAMQDRLILWNLSAVRSILARGTDWQGLGVSRAAPLAGAGWAAVANGSLLVTGSSLEKLDSGGMFARRIEDLISLSLRWQAEGETRKARAMLDDLWKKQRSAPGPGAEVALARARVEAANEKAGAAEKWIEEARKLASKDSELDAALAHEQMWIRFFLEGDRKGVRRHIAQMTKPVAASPRVLWMRDLLDSEEDSAIETWRQIGRAVKLERWREAAAALAEIAQANPDYLLTRRGAGLLLRGEFEPLRLLAPEDPLAYPELLTEPLFQQGLLALAGDDLSDEISKADLRGILLLQWAKGGQFQAARDLAGQDLRDPEGSSLDYRDLIERYLDPEEEEPWIELACGEVLLDRGIERLLDQEMADTRAHLILLLAKAKRGLVAGDDARAGAALDQLERDLAIVNTSFWDARTARYPFLAHLYRAKLFERQAKWTDAEKAYERSLGVIDDYPADWELAAFDVRMMKALLASGKDDPDLLRTFLKAVRDIGDPLLNPRFAGSLLGAGLTNLQTMKTHAADAWLAPFIDYFEGSALAASGQPHRAIAAFHRCERREPPADLGARALMEEAATRALLGQNRLAAGVAERLARLELDPPRLTVAIFNRAQYERESGLVESSDARIRELAQELRLPARWADTLLAAPHEEAADETHGGEPEP